MQADLAYAIKFVADMDRAVAFYRDTFGLKLRFQTAEWTEFETGPVTLALHAASEANPPGKVQLGFATRELHAAYAAREAAGLTFTQPPTDTHGATLARILDCDGAEISLSTPA
jgi:predicted enzyme related to lactoylglutathione lyase